MQRSKQNFVGFLALVFIEPKKHGSQRDSMERGVNLYFLNCRIRKCAGINFWNKNFQNFYNVLIN